MTNISSLLSSSYFSLKNESSSADKAQTMQPGLAQALASLNGQSGTANSTDSISLSPEAKAYMQSLSGNGAATSSTDSFLLDKEQRAAIQAIIANYKDAPYTQETFESIKEDLKNAGLSPEILAAQDKMRTFNPTIFLLDALNGTNNSANIPGQSEEASNTKSYNYMSSVLKQWQAISTTMEEGDS